MAHYAFLDENNIVTEVIVGKDETEIIDGLTPEQWYWAFRNQPCVRTSYNARIRGNYAGIGYSYLPTEDLFVPPKCHPEALLEIDKALWSCTNKEHDVQPYN
jgi:hypothetical protein